MLFSTQLSSSQLQSLGSCNALQLRETWHQGATAPGCSRGCVPLSHPFCSSSPCTNPLSFPPEITFLPITLPASLWAIFTVW